MKSQESGAVNNTPLNTTQCLTSRHHCGNTNTAVVIIKTNNNEMQITTEVFTA
jgi:hypothetical protein